MGMIISRHFDAVGGFSTRQRQSRFMTVLPFSDFKESREILEAFADELRANGFEYVKTKNKDGGDASSDIYKISVIAGLAQGEVAMEGIQDVLKKARKNLFEIGRFQCIEGSCKL